MTWKEAFSTRKFRIEFFITIILLVIILAVLANYLKYIEQREGVVLNDPLLNLFTPVDLTWLTFGVLYISVFAAIYLFSKNPGLLLTGFQSYILLVIFRITAMYLLPLNAPERMIPLKDPLVEFFGTGQLMTKDLFFSGHTSTVFLLFLLADKKSLKILFLSAVIVIAAGVLLQHVHYSIDVLAAPFFAYGGYSIISKIRNKT